MLNKYIIFKNVSEEKPIKLLMFLQKNLDVSLNEYIQIFIQNIFSYQLGPDQKIGITQ